MESIKDDLTNEKLRNRFTSQFELVNYAIKLAENMIKTGRAPRIATDVQNLAIQILEEIVAGKDKFEEILPEHLEAAARKIELNGREHRDESGSSKSVERKRPRKILAD